MKLELAVATACSKCRQIIHRFPPLEELVENTGKVWTRSELLSHPYIQVERGFVFIHVPKAAGTSLNTALGLNAPLTCTRHDRARDVLPFLKILAPNVNSISFVRDPYARFVSLYNFARADESLYHSSRDPKGAPRGKHGDYDTLLNKSLEECAELLVQGKLGPSGNNPIIWAPQVEWLIDKYGILMVDFIGRVESLALDLERLQQIYGIVAVKPFPWLNKSCGDRQNIPQWTERARDLVRLYYKRDFEMLGYDE